MSEVYIKATYAGNQSLVSVLEAWLDPQYVTVTRSEYAIKSIVPLDLAIVVPTTFLLNKFILEPLLEPYLDKWKDAVKRRLHPLTPFNLIIQITNEGREIHAPLDTSHDRVAEIWSIIYTALSILEKNDVLSEISTIRFMPSATGELLVFCYTQNKPVRMVHLDKGVITEIPVELASTSNMVISSPETFAQKVMEQSDAYRKMVAEYQMENSEQMSKPSEKDGV